MLATLDQIKAALGITDNTKDALLTSCLQQANTMIASYIGADLSDTAERTHTGTIPCGATYLHLPVWPVLEVNSALVNCTPVPPTDFFVDRRSGSLFFENEQGGTGRRGVPVEIAYTAGFASDAIPADLNMVCLNIASAIYNVGGTLAGSTGGTGELKSLTMFDAMSMSFDTGSSTASTPETYVTSWTFMLNKYKLDVPVMK
jgi:hypothetical protein